MYDNLQMIFFKHGKKIETADPVTMPELKEKAMDINFCYNPICVNFGVSWHQSIKDNKDLYSIKKVLIPLD